MRAACGPVCARESTATDNKKSDGRLILMLNILAFRLLVVRQNLWYISAKKMY